MESAEFDEHKSAYDARKAHPDSAQPDSELSAESNLVSIQPLPSLSFVNDAYARRISTD
jgi:hypothetical protein